MANWEAAIKGITQSIQDYGEIQGERSKLIMGILANQLKAHTNWFYKQQELAYQKPHEKAMEQILKQQYPELFEGAGMGDEGAAPVGPGIGGYRDITPPGGIVGRLPEGMGGGMGEARGPRLLEPTEPATESTPEIRPFTEEVRPKVRVGAGGYGMAYPSRKEYIYSRIQEKERRKMPLTKAETEFKEEFLGTKEPTGYEEKAQWKQKDAQRTLFGAYLDSLYEGVSQEESLLGLPGKGYAGPLTSKAEIIRRFKQGRPVDIITGAQGKKTLDTKKTLRRLGRTIDDFYRWAAESQPDLFKMAFPGRTMLGE